MSNLNTVFLGYFDPVNIRVYYLKNTNRGELPDTSAEKKHLLTGMPAKGSTLVTPGLHTHRVGSAVQKGTRCGPDIPALFSEQLQRLHVHFHAPAITPHHSLF